jgi:hypothetical protein
MNNKWKEKGDNFSIMMEWILMTEMKKYIL